MGLCSFLFKTTGCVLVAILAVLAYFVFDCYGRNHAQEECPFNDHFDREATDLHNIPIPFTTKGQVSHGHLGLDFLGMQTEWCVLSKIVYLISAKTTHKTNPQMRNISFWDARKHKPGSFHETGFTLLKLEKMPETTDWETSGLHDPVNADVVKFHRQMVVIFSIRLTLQISNLIYSVGPPHQETLSKSQKDPLDAKCCQRRLRWQSPEGFLRTYRLPP